MKIAIDTGKSKIVDVVATAVKFRNDVFDVQPKENLLDEGNNTRKRSEHAREPEP
jgi:hypothetical protein